MTDATNERPASGTEDPAGIGHGEYDLPSNGPVYDCEHCGRPFAREEWLRLHRGLAHPGALDEGEIEAFRDAYTEEERTLRTFRLKTLGLLLVVYFGLLMVYVLVLYGGV